MIFFRCMLPECSLPALIGGTDPNGGSCAGGEDDVILTRWMGFLFCSPAGIGHWSFSRVTQTRTGVHRGTEVYEIV